MSIYQHYEARDLELGDIRHSGRRYAGGHLLSRAVTYRCRNHKAVLVLMIISASKSCQPLLDMLSLWMIANWTEQTTETHHISQGWFTWMVNDTIESYSRR